MSERKRHRRPRVTLCAALTFDGKLDASDPLPPALLAALEIADGDVLLADAATARSLPPPAILPLRLIDRAALRDLPGFLLAPPARRWLCPGGPKIFRALLDAGLVNDLCLLLRPHIDGRRAADTLSGPPTPAWFPRSISCRLRRMEVHGGECVLHYKVGPPAARSAP